MKKHTFKEVKQYFKDHGCELLEKEYKDNRTPMKYRCSCGNPDICKITFYRFKVGQRCQKCSSIKKAERHRLTYEDVKQYFEDHDCELLETEYINNQTPMRYICDCGNDECKIRFYSFKRGSRCKKCAIERRIGENNCNWIEDREELKEINKFKKKCRNILSSALKRTGQLKNNKTYTMLGYSSEELREHIYNHPNWEKVKDGKWHLDHIMPIKAFADYGIKDIKLINCFENLQPLLAIDNSKKHDKYDEKEFEEWLIGKGYEIISQ